MTIHYLMILGGYLFGSISAAIIVCKLMGLPDPRTRGSRNPGATNVARLGGKKAAALTLAGDMLKGLLPVLLARALGAGIEIQAATALAAFLGHLYPVFFGFQGGKGVATAFGVAFGLDWRIGALSIGGWLVMALLFRYSSLAALASMLLVPAGLWWLQGNTVTTALMTLMVVMLYWRHRSNIRNLLSGAEEKIAFGDKRDS